MGIIVNENMFHLQTKDTSYIMMVNQGGYLCHVYYGSIIDQFTLKDRALWEETNLEMLPQECSVFGSGEFRSPTLVVEQESGSMVNELVFQGYRISKGKPALPGLPSSYCREQDQVETLEVILEDRAAGVEACLLYSVFPTYNVITRSARYINTGEAPIMLHRALSLTIDYREDGYELMQLSGAWGREKQRVLRKLAPGITAIDSKRGISGAVQNPFLALLKDGWTEETGEVYGFNLVYSGNFLASAEVDSYHCTRISMGINPFAFCWELKGEEAFQTPEAVLVYSGNGLGEMTRKFHRFYRERLCRETDQYKERPILINNWEATYFDFTEEKIIAIAKAAAELGMELFVLDDGWFGHRDSDNSSLGDWVPNRKKLPDGIASLAEKVESMGIKFGLWFEPEMISRDSGLYEQHPDWCLHVPERAPKDGQHQRNQLVLDLTRNDVCDYVIESVSKVLSNAKISYVKWDMNRALTDLGSVTLSSRRQGEVSHRYVLGLYHILECITSRFPNILFESCSSGGGRFDPGMLFYMPQTWTSDDTDAVERIRIQYGTSMVYPAITMGCHVSGCPNAQVGRIESLKMRAEVAMSGNFGYEVDVSSFSEEERKEVREQVAFYKQIRKIIKEGDLYRMISPYDGERNEAAYCYVMPDKSEAVVFYYQILARPNVRRKRLLIKGLDGMRHYEIVGRNQYAYGEELLRYGVEEDVPSGDFASMVLCLREVRE